MTSHPPGSQREPDTIDEREWMAIAAFAFVILALVALAFTPALVLGRITKAADEIILTIVPANDALGDLAFAMEERVTASRSRFLTDDPRYDVRLAEAKRQEEAALRTLTELAPRFGPLTSRHFDSLRRHMADRDSIEARIVDSGEELEEFESALPRFDAIRDSMLIELTGFRRELLAAAEQRAAEERGLADLQRVLSVVLGMLALVSAFLVGWFSLRQRRLRRGAQAALAEARQQRVLAERRGSELEQATEARARLLRGVTHDVKNPLGAARGYAELLEMGIKAPLHPAQAPLVSGVIRSVDSALSIIADLLDLVRASSDGLAVNRVEVDLAEVARNAAEEHRSAAERAGHLVDVSRPDGKLVVFTDPQRVAQVLGNLLSNAIKYTPPPGTISVQVGLRTGRPPFPGRPWAVVQVSDTGPGIPPDQREAIFDEFTRLDDAGLQKGHGLGLAIARRVARLLGGDVTVEDAPGGGSNFILWLPERAADELEGSAIAERKRG